ncbi:MAG: hypothetical protein WCM93_14455, partial [Bacteroidota bacterium]
MEVGMTGYWIRERERFLEISEAETSTVKVEGLDLFVHHVYYLGHYGKNYNVTEGRSGLAVFTAPKRKAAIDGAKARIERMGIGKILECVDSSVSNSGLSPRYGGEVEVGIAPDPYMDMIIKNKKMLQTYSNVFESIFKVRLSNFWNNLHGFEVVKFDDQVIRSGDGCMSDKVVEVYGEEEQK